MDRWLLVRRSLRDPDELAFTCAQAPWLFPGACSRGWAPLVHRGRLPDRQGRGRPGPLRGPPLARLAPPLTLALLAHAFLATAMRPMSKGGRARDRSWRAAGAGRAGDQAPMGYPSPPYSCRRPRLRLAWSLWFIRTGPAPVEPIRRRHRQVRLEWLGYPDRACYQTVPAINTGIMRSAGARSRYPRLISRRRCRPRRAAPTRHEARAVRSSAGSATPGAAASAASPRAPSSNGDERGRPRRRGQAAVDRAPLVPANTTRARPCRTNSHLRCPATCSRMEQSVAPGRALGGCRTSSVRPPITAMRSLIQPSNPVV